MSKYSQDVINILYNNMNEYISGQYIADQLNISRAAVKKVIDQLKEEGCDIVSINHKGHQLKQLPDVWYSGIVKSLMNQNAFFDKIETYHTVESTQSVAKQALLENENTFLILSDEQSAGRGRFNRNWDSSKGKGLWMSLVLRPHVPFAMIPKFNLFIALAIRDAIQSFTNDKVEIKWPNDIYIQNKKVCGFLTEMIANYDHIEAIICGVGINMNHESNDFPKEIIEKATSIRQHRDDKLNRYEFLSVLTKHIVKRYLEFLELPFKSIREEYKIVSNIWNKTLRFTENNHQFMGKAIDIDYDGLLIVEDSNGHQHKLMSADIEF